jgi:DNA-binding transcriptional ArsR family regulator
MPKKSLPKDICQIFCFNKEKVNKIKKVIIPQEKLVTLAELFKTISDNTRIKILLALRESELCVCDISHILGLSISTVSHQLRILRNLRLVKYRNEGKLVFYSLTDKHIIRLIEAGARHISERV